MSESYITSIATAIPENRIRQIDALEYLKNSFENLDEKAARKMDVIFKKSGIENRFTVLESFAQKKNYLWGESKEEIPSTEERMQAYKKHALPLASSASKKALTNEGNEHPDYLITITCTGLSAPGLEINLSQDLELNGSHQRSAINFMGCYAAFHGIRQAHQILRTHPDYKVLINTTELCSLHFQRESDDRNILANSLFGDGSASIVMRSEPSPGKNLKLLGSKGYLLPQGKSKLSWDVSSTGFSMFLSSELPELVKENLPDLIEDFLNSQNTSLEEIDFVAAHPGGIRILNNIEAVLDLEQSKMKASFDTLAEFGNMSSSTILFVFEKLFEVLDETQNEKKVLAMAFGPGFTVELALLEVVNV